jgi:hypothetical protein
MNVINEINPSLVIDKLFLGNMTDAENKEVLLKNGITHILVAGNYLTAYFPEVNYKKY